MLRLLAALLSFALGVAVAAPQPIEGHYRYGHEVNTFCTGEPEKCYWLVDTDAEIRAQLKRQVTGLPPYTPVCLRLEAELSTQKADGFGLDYDGSVRVSKLLGHCEDAAAITIEDLQHRRWVLHSIDGATLDRFAAGLGFEGDAARSKLPDLDFGEQGFVSGNTGCNQVHGQARVVDGELILSRMATTMMACDGFAGELELQLQLMYRNPLAITLDGSELLLDALDRRLRFKRRDWVQ